jgi:dTDP-4-dehydrorhamnose reductase
MAGPLPREPSSDKALVVGGDGLVGAALREACGARGLAVAATSRRAARGAIPFDLAAPDFAALEREPYASVFVCAAVTDMRACQQDPARSRRVNVTSTLELMRRLAARGSHLVFLSSSQVFDGEEPLPAEDAPTNPKNEYGAQKLAVERAIADEGLPAAVLRPSKVLAAHPVGMFRTWSEALRRNQPVEAASNMTLSPVSVADVAEASLGLARGRHGGIWHLSAEDEIAYDAAARLMAERQGLPQALVRGRALGEAQVPAIYRHRHTALDCRKIAAALGLPIRRARPVLEALFGRVQDGRVAAGGGP